MDLLVADEQRFAVWIGNDDVSFRLFWAAMEASTNLVPWAKIAVRANLTGLVELTDNSATSFPQRFYRAVAP